MLRWLLRLVVVGLIGLGVAYAVSRLMGQDEDFDDFDDIEAGFEFEETPVEIDVPLQAGGGSMELGAGEESMTASSDADTSGEGGGSGRGSQGGNSNGGEGGGNLTDINGIGPNYAARLEAAGIMSIADLAAANAEDIAAKMDVIGGSSAIEDWISQAKGMGSGER